MQGAFSSKVAEFNRVVTSAPRWPSYCLDFLDLFVVGRRNSICITSGGPGVRSGNGGT